MHSPRKRGHGDSSAFFLGFAQVICGVFPAEAGMKKIGHFGFFRRQAENVLVAAPRKVPARRRSELIPNAVGRDPVREDLMRPAIRGQRSHCVGAIVVYWEIDRYRRRDVAT